MGRVRYVRMYLVKGPEVSMVPSKIEAWRMKLYSVLATALPISSDHAFNSKMKSKCFCNIIDISSCCDFITSTCGLEPRCAD